MFDFQMKKERVRYGVGTNSSLKHLTLNQNGWPFRFCTSSKWTEHLSRFLWKSFKEWGRYEKDTQLWLKHLILKCDLDTEPLWRVQTFCTVSQGAEHLSQVLWKTFKECKWYETDTTQPNSWPSWTLWLRCKNATRVWQALNILSPQRGTLRTFSNQMRCRIVKSVSYKVGVLIKQ